VDNPALTIKQQGAPSRVSYATRLGGPQGSQRAHPFRHGEEAHRYPGGPPTRPRGPRRRAAGRAWLLVA